MPLSKATYNKYILSEGRETTIYRCRYRKDVHRTKCQALNNCEVNPFPVYNKDAKE